MPGCSRPRGITLSRAQLWVAGDRIAEVVPGPTASPTPGQVVSLRGMTLLPGLIDAHVHAVAVEADIQDQDRHLFDSELAVLTAQSLTDMLHRGFTTVRDAGGADAGFRRLIEQGTIAGPRLLVSGRPLTQTGGHGDKRPAMEPTGAAVPSRALGMTHAVADGPDGVRRAVREELRRGADQIKVMAGGGVMSPTDRLESVQYSLEELTAAVATAAASGSYVLAHAYTPEAIEVCVAAGVRSIEHGNLLNDRAAGRMAEAGTFLVPTLVTYEKLHEQGAELGIPAANLDKLKAIIEAGLESLRLPAGRASGSARGPTCSGPCAGSRDRKSHGRPMPSARRQRSSRRRRRMPSCCASTPARSNGQAGRPGRDRRRSPC